MPIEIKILYFIIKFLTEANDNYDKNWFAYLTLWVLLISFLI